MAKIQDKKENSENDNDRIFAEIIVYVTILAIGLSKGCKKLVKKLSLDKKLSEMPD